MIRTVGFNVVSNVLEVDLPYLGTWTEERSRSHTYHLGGRFSRAGDPCEREMGAL